MVSLLARKCATILLARGDAREAVVRATDTLLVQRPTPIQREALPLALAGKDVIGLAETGSGKTGAFALPIIQTLLGCDKPTPFFALILAPTRELAFQIGETFEALGTVIGLKTCVIVGGVDQMQQALALAKKPHVVIATPGRILQHLETTKGAFIHTRSYLYCSAFG